MRHLLYLEATSAIRISPPGDARRAIRARAARRLGSDMLRFFRRRDRLRKKPPKTLRIVQYEPSGRGGFCHYTFELAQGLTRNGCAVTLMTAGNYELAHLPHAFRRLPLVRRSRTKRFLESLFRRNTAASNRPGEPVDRPSREWTAPPRACLL